MLLLCHESNAGLSDRGDGEGEERHPALRGLICHEILQVDAQEVSGSSGDRAGGVGRHLADVENDGEGILQEVVPSDVGDARQRLLELVEQFGDGVCWLGVGPVVGADAEPHRRSCAVRKRWRRTCSAGGTGTDEGVRLAWVRVVSESEPDVAESRERPNGAQGERRGTGRDLVYHLVYSHGGD